MEFNAAPVNNTTKKFLHLRVSNVRSHTEKSDPSLELWEMFSYALHLNNLRVILAFAFVYCDL